jgi:ATP-binding cassette subfamily B protein
LGLQLLSILAAVGEVASLGALLPFLRLLANPQESLNTFGTLGELLPNLPIQYIILSLGLVFISMVFLSTLLRTYAIRSQFRLGALITTDLGDQVFRGVLAFPYSWHIQQNSSNILGHLTKDVEQVYTSIQSILILVVNLSVVLLLGVTLIGLAPSVMPLVALVLISYYVIIYRFTRAQLSRDGAALSINYQKSLQFAQEGLGGIRDVLLDGTQSFFLNSYRQSYAAYRLAYASMNIKAQVPRYMIEGFVVILIVVVSLILVISGEGIQKQLPLLGTLTLGAYRLLQPLQLCFGSYSTLQANQESFQRILPYLTSKTHKQITLSAVLHELPSVEHCNAINSVPLLQLEDLSFSYKQKGPYVLKGIELSIGKGERMAIVGTTGSGKSTCSDLILGLLSPTGGRVLLEGADLHATPGLLSDWKSRVAHVPQQIFLTDDSFTANIAFGVPADQIDHTRVQLAAEQARISTMINSTPKCYATLVGERGVSLSGGQRQRIGIARALYKQAQLLVLDEATSALDNRTEAEVMEAIESLDQELTVILIAHRLSTVRNCDRIVVLDQGRISGIGRYDDLLSSHAGFQAMANQP